MATQSSRRVQLWSSATTLLLGVVLALTGCASGSGTASGSASGSTTSGGAGSSSAAATHTSGGSAAPTATPRPAPPHAFAWYQFDSHSTPQIWASVNGASPTQITHLAPPDPNGCDNELAWSPPVFSPDLTHIVSAIGGYNCGDGFLMGQLNVITVSGGAMTAVPVSTVDVRLTERGAGWLDSSTVWFIGTDGAAYTYHLGSGSSAQISGISGATEAAVRGGTLFWQSYTVSGTQWSYTLHRYDLGAHSGLSGSINQGAWGACQCSPGDVASPGWDASPDGAHVAYQVVTPSSSTSGGITSSHIYYAAADGSGASQIARAMVTTTQVKMQLSPDGRWVAFTQAAPTPMTLTASVSSPGGSGDTTFHAYSPDTYDYPVWKWDSSQFWAASAAAPANPGGGSSSSLYRFNLGGGSSVGVSGGNNPWYTIGA